MNETLILDWVNFNASLDDYIETREPINSTTKIVTTIVLYVLVALLSLAGNIVIIWTICERRAMKTAANYLMVSIAIADIILVVIYTPLLLVSVINTSWPFDNATCKLFHLVPPTAQSIVHISLIALSIVWFKIVVCPSQKLLTKREGVMIAIAIWVVGFFVTIPNWIYAHLETAYNLDTYCISYWPSPQEARNSAMYLIFYFTWTYFVPAVWIICSYVIISDKLFRTYSVVGRPHDSIHDVTYTKQSVKMMMAVTAMQFICFCPLIVLQIGVKFVHEFDIPEFVFLLIDWIAFTTVLWKPIIYLCANAKIRRNVKVTFTWFPCIKQDDY